MPHSEIHGSKLVCNSPWLIAAYHVLHRLLVPRHPPYALSNLTKNSRRNLSFRKNHNILFSCQRTSFDMPDNSVEHSTLFYLSKPEAPTRPRLLLNIWRRPGSNRRPIACKAIALPTELRPLNLDRSTHHAQIVGLSGVGPWPPVWANHRPSLRTL